MNKNIDIRNFLNITTEQSITENLIAMIREMKLSKKRCMDILEHIESIIK